MESRARAGYPKSAKRTNDMTFQLDVFDDFHLHGASAPEWNQRYVQMSRGAMRSTLAEATAGSLHVFRKWMSERVVQEGCLPAGQICFAIALRPGDGTPRMQGREMADESLFVLRGDEAFSLHRPRGMELLAVTFELAQFERLRDERPLAPQAEASLAKTIVQVGAAPLQRLRDELLATFDAGPNGSMPERLAPHAVFDAIGALLEDASGATQSVRSASASYLVAQAHRLVARSGDEPPSVDALCRRLRTSPRTLQNAFVQVAGTTPADYLRNVRLDAVRRELRTTRPAELSIAQAALGRGFSHLGRFAQQYREVFGERPSQTPRAG